MRKQLIGATAVLLGAASIGLAVPAAPSHASAWKTLDKIPFPAGVVQDVEVVSTGNGDAVAAAIISGAVHSYTATDGVWTDHALVRVDVNAERLLLATDESGETAIGWLEMVNGDKRLRVARQTSPTSWTGVGLSPMTPAGADVTGTPELGITSGGLVIVAATIDDGADIEQRLIVNEWPRNGQIGTPKVLSTSDASNPSLDVNSKGEALVAYNYTGLIKNVLSVNRRTPGVGWNVGDSTSNSGNIASAPDVAISENGTGQVIYSVVSNDFYRVETSRVLTTGVALDAELVEASEDFTSEPSVDMNSSGAALFAWISKKDGVTSVRHASAANGAYPGVAAPLPGTLADAEAPIAKVGEGSLRVIQHRGNGRITTHLRNTAVAQPFAGVTTPAGFGADSELDVDSYGNAVLAGFTADGVFARFFDGSAPTVTILKPFSSTTVGTQIPISWSTSDSLSALQPTSDVYLTKARWNQGAFTDPKLSHDNVDGKTATYTGLPGTTYCFQVRRSDTANNGGNSAKKCTTIPLDDRSLAGSGWSRGTNSGAFKGTWTTTSTKGRVLTRSGVQAKTLALVASKLPTGGTVRVSWNGSTLKTISLKGKTGNKKVLPIVTWAGLHTGTVKITVTSASGKSVRIDGLVVGK